MSIEPEVVSEGDEQGGNGDLIQVPRSAAQVDDENPPRLPFPVVAIGASAGGLEAFMEFFQNMPPKPGMAFVLVQHLPPDRESMISEILRRHTPMPVDQIEDGMVVQPDHVYVIRPGRTLTLKDGRLHLSEPLTTPRHGRPVDDLFRSVAEEQRERAICIVMSGMGSNGTAGTEEVKAVGGLAIAQDPESAKFPSMPRHLVDSHLADLILKPSEMPAALLKYAQHSYASGHGGPSAGSPRTEQALSDILTILRTRARHDFTGYKKATILRRIQRRMGLCQIENLIDYAALLRQTPGEIQALVDDLLIHVTGFFRDPEAWEALREHVLLPLVREKETNGAIRCWVSACSSGEEAYTLAILLNEVAAMERKTVDIKIFATDMAERTLSHARSGLYPGGIETEISPERLERYFDREDSLYRIKREIRECVVFAPQNVTQDPPFSRLDVVTCRNLLIYLEPDLQARVLALLHFGLMDGGVLFLGSSETASAADGYFEAIDKRFRIYRRLGPTRHGQIEFSRLAGIQSAEFERAPGRPLPKISLAQLTNRILLERHTPAAVTTDRQLRIMYFHGQTDEFLSLPGGEPTRDLLSLVRESIRGAVRVATQKAMTEGQPQSVKDGLIETLDGPFRVVVTAELLDERVAPGFLLVSFQKVRDPEPVHTLLLEGNGQNASLQEELQRVRDELQSTVEELQSSNEELRAANEETMSINEELQSSNEELETSKEELQSLNEELVTVNAQLQAKMEELESTTNDLSSLLASTDIAVVFLDTRFRIRQFTPAIRDLIELIPSDIGRPLNDLAKKFHDPGLMADCAEVLERLIPREIEVSSESGRHYMRRVHPYRTTDDRITGVVLTFIDVTHRKKAEILLRASEEQMRLLVEGANEFAMILLDADGRITSWSPGAERLLGYTERQAIGQSGEILLPPERREEEWREELEEARKTGKSAEDRQHTRRDGSEFWGSGVLHALYDLNGNISGFVKILRDDSVRKEQEDAQGKTIRAERRARRDAEWATGMRDRFLAVLSHELRTPLSSILLWSQILSDKNLSEEQRQQGLAALQISAESQKQLLDELLDTSRIASGKIQLQPRPTDVGELISTTVEMMQPSAQTAGIAVEMDLQPSRLVSLLDPDRIRQVLTNLLTNAIKFNSAGGSVSVRLRTTPQEIHLQVSDTGQGIAPEFLPEIFEPFTQQEREATRSLGGLGLGLAISRQLVQLHGGSIRASSPGIGQGSRFQVRLPYTRPSESPAGGAAPADGPATIPPGFRILLVEDDEQTRIAIVRLLERAGAEVSTLASPAQVLDELQRFNPQLILSDVGLPEEDGFAMMRRVREFEETNQRPPVSAIALTAFAREDDQLQALVSGFQQHVSKPVDGERLIRIIADYAQP